jgi:hypothetical protein
MSLSAIQTLSRTNSPERAAPSFPILMADSATPGEVNARYDCPDFYKTLQDLNRKLSEIERMQRNLNKNLQGQPDEARLQMLKGAAAQMRVISEAATRITANFFRNCDDDGDGGENNRMLNSVEYVSKKIDTIYSDTDDAARKVEFAYNMAGIGQRTAEISNIISDFFGKIFEIFRLLRRFSGEN